MYSSPVHMGQYGGQKEYRQLARGMVTFEGEVKLKQLIKIVHYGHLIYIANIKMFRIFFNMIIHLFGHTDLWDLPAVEDRQLQV